jgi:hypothetical protein
VSAYDLELLKMAADRDFFSLLIRQTPPCVPIFGGWPGRKKFKSGDGERSGSDVLRREKELRRLLDYVPVVGLPAVNQCWGWSKMPNSSILET